MPQHCCAQCTQPAHQAHTQPPLNTRRPPCVEHCKPSSCQLCAGYWVTPPCLMTLQRCPQNGHKPQKHTSTACRGAIAVFTLNSHSTPGEPHPALSTASYQPVKHCEVFPYSASEGPASLHPSTPYQLSSLHALCRISSDTCLSDGRVSLLHTHCVADGSMGLHHCLHTITIP
jgi:hypothetical protein